MKTKQVLLTLEELRKSIELSQMAVIKLMFLVHEATANSSAESEETTE